MSHLARMQTAYESDQRRKQTGITGKKSKEIPHLISVFIRLGFHLAQFCFHVNHSSISLLHLQITTKYYENMTTSKLLSQSNASNAKHTWFLHLVDSPRTVVEVSLPLARALGPENKQTLQLQLNKSTRLVGVHENSHIIFIFTKDTQSYNQEQKC